MALKLHKDMSGTWMLQGKAILCDGCICELEMGMGMNSFCSSPHQQN